MFGINDNKAADGTVPTGPPPVVPPPMPGDPAQPTDEIPSMPMPDPMASPQPTDQQAFSYDSVSNPVSTPAVVSPTMPAMPDPMAMPMPAPVEPSAPDGMAVPMPAPLTDQTTDFSATDSFTSTDTTTPDDHPKITSNYDSKPGSAPATPPENEDELLEIKKQALESLTPLVDELEQSPEEKFKTTMMLIQASDNADLVKEAFSAANAIADEKARAQALLDVVNEINYFTQPHEN